MNPKHCVSLELAKQMKEAGWKKETEFWWTDCNDKFEVVDKYYDLCSYVHDCLANGSPCNGQPIYKFADIKDMDFDIYPAPLATEILEELPFGLEGENGNDILKIERYKNGYSVCYFDDGQDKYTGKTHLLKMSDTLPNALAKMWLYLKKGGIER